MILAAAFLIWCAAAVVIAVLFGAVAHDEDDTQPQPREDGKGFPR